MSPGVLAAVSLLGGIGALGRLLVDGRVAARTRTLLPAGILVVNLTGAFALGVLVGLETSTDVLRIAGVGLLGGYTTFSTWMLQTARLAEQGHRTAAAANVALSLTLGLALAWLGREIGSAL